MSKVDEKTFDTVADTLVHAPLGMPIAEIISTTGLPGETVRKVLRAMTSASWVDTFRHVLVKGNVRAVYKLTSKGERLYKQLRFDARREV